MIIVECTDGVLDVIYNPTDEDILKIDWDDIADDLYMATSLWEKISSENIPQNIKGFVKASIYNIWEYDAKSMFFLLEHECNDLDEWARSQDYLFCDGNHPGDLEEACAPGGCGWVDYDDEPVDIADLFAEAVTKWEYNGGA